MEYIPIIISVLSLVLSAIVGFSAIASRNTQDDRHATSQITTLIVKLENIADGINEIKSDMRNVKNDIQDLRERLVIVEQSSKSAHHRIDLMTGQERE